MRNNYSTSILSRKSVFRILKLLCFSLALGNTAAEEPAFDSHIEFHTFPADFGYRAVRTMLQDHKGLLWFGSENGLIRFDGSLLKAYEFAEGKQDLGSNLVTALAEDKSKRLWVGTNDGLKIYDRTLDRFFAASHVLGFDTGLDAFNISSLTLGSDSILWIGTYSQGFFGLDVDNKQLFDHSAFINDLRNTNIVSSYHVSYDSIWIGTEDGLVHYNPVTRAYQWLLSRAQKPDGLSGDYITSIKQDDFGNVWVSTQDNGLNLLISYEAGNAVFEHYFTQDDAKVKGREINTLLPDQEGNLWIGTVNNGLIRFHIPTRRPTVFEHEPGNHRSLTSNSIWSLLSDREGRLWVGSYNKGISVYDAYHSKFETFNRNPSASKGLPGDDVRGFCETSDGVVWIAIDGKGLSRFYPWSGTFDGKVDNYEFNKALSHRSSQAIVSDKADHVWIGYWGGGVDRINSAGTLLRNYQLESKLGIGNNKIKTLYRCKQGRIWAGTNGSGLFLYNKATDGFESYTFPGVLDERAYVNAVFSNDSSKLWVGTNQALIQFILNVDGQVINAKTYTSSNTALSSDVVTTIHIDKKDLLWVGTSNKGINFYDPKQQLFTVINKEQGLPGNSISGIIEDDMGEIWVSTNAGIARINTNNIVVQSFNKEDGLSSNDFYAKAVLKTSDGHLLFGNQRGFNRIHPKDIKENKTPPSILLNNLKINNKLINIEEKGSPLSKQLSETSLLVLEHWENSFSIEYVALNYTRPSQNSYAYILEGYDHSWNYVGNQRAAHYTQIKPGKYVFKVIGTNNDGVWSKEAAELQIVIRSPIWKTGWAYLTYIMIFLVLALLAVRAWNQRVQLQMRLKNERLAKEKELELNKKNLHFFTNISHEFRTPLSLIVASIDAVMATNSGADRERLSTVKANADRLLTLTNNLLDLTKLEGQEMHLNKRPTALIEHTKRTIDLFSGQMALNHIKPLINLPDEEQTLLLDQDKYASILINLLSNALKFTPADGQISIGLSYSEKQGRIEVIISNSGGGILPADLPRVFDKFYQSSHSEKAPKAGSGIGLALTKELVELHGGKIWVHSTPNTITEFVFTLPAEKPTVGQPEKSSSLANSYPFGNKSDELRNVQYEAETAKTEVPVVLVVEDNEELGTFFKRELAPFYQVILGKDGEEGLDLAASIVPDLIISDVVMPKMSGIDLCKKVKSDLQTSHIPFILLTAKTTELEQVEGYETGADAYVTKPFHFKILKSQIANLIQSRETLYAQFSQDVYLQARKLSSNDSDRIFIETTIDYILQNLIDSKLDIAELAQLHNMSHRNFYRKLKALSGNTVVKFIRLVRLKQAIKLMKSKQYNLTEIAQLTGFSSPSYFTKCFRELYGKPPSEFI